jgi:murein DD-endopeptidase MepM/ murein hydrolase activator NlpD
VVAVLALISARAHADDEPGPTPVIAATTTPVTGREAIAAALAAQAETISRTLGTLATKLHAADATRAARARAAYRVLAAPLAADASLEDRLIAARRRAGVRLLLARDLGERALLADEAGHLEDAARRTVAATARARELTLPLHLAWPARGTIARHVGVLIHERSKATLARRGLDLDVDDRAPARAAADGVVRYAGPIRGLDAGVIIAHGDYLTVTAKLAGLEVAAGDEVHVGDRLGHAAKHRVYFEVRARAGAGGLPIDPEPLLGDR